MLKLKSSEDSQVWFSSDLHCLHKNICYGTSVWDDKETNCRRFDNPNQMTDIIIDNFNKLVQLEDHLFLLGDLLFHYKDEDTYKRLLSRFNCNNIYLLYGNHSHRNNLFKAYSEDLRIIDLQDYLEIEIDGKLICMSHYPMESWNDRHQTSYMLHGHEHGRNRIIPRRLDVGIDNYFKLFGEYKPFNWKEIKNILK
jgi:calcineurin-like phosphoesterase family protein